MRRSGRWTRQSGGDASGSVLSDSLLSARKNDFLLAVCAAPGASLPDDEGGRTRAGAARPPSSEEPPVLALAAADLFTGELVASLVPAHRLEAEVPRFEPSEVLLPRSWEGRTLEGRGQDTHDCGGGR